MNWTNRGGSNLMMTVQSTMTINNRSMPLYTIESSRTLIGKPPTLAVTHCSGLSRTRDAHEANEEQLI